MKVFEDAVPFGHKNAISRKKLAETVGLSDRSIRNAINKSDCLIINVQDGKGYFRPLPEDRKLVEAWMKIFESRIKEEFKRLRLARKWVKKNR